MERGFGHRAPLGLRTLHATGTLGGLGDARLIERFLDLEGPDREDAFAVLVQRHGPSVLGICRRMLGGPANAGVDADDAFQAVFLVLARKAGSLRQVDDLGPWLRAVAVRVSQEARRRSARLRSREGGTLADPPAAAATDPDLFELRAFLDEELQRLPRRYREPLRLCELEGATRHDAAQRLGIPEGTLSTRLARGRVMLRDRLTRRGVAVGTLGAMFPSPARAGSLGALADASTRLALKFAARDAAPGTVPAAVASLAEGVLLMIHAAKLKTALLATSTLVAACLTAGLVAGRASPPAEAPPKVVARVAESPKKDKPREPLQARGVVVDESGNPVAGAEVRLNAHTPRERQIVTGPNGAFAIPVPERTLDGRSLLARADDGDRKIGVFRYDYNLTRAEADKPVRIEVKLSREIVAHVTNAGEQPVAGAVVEVVGRFAIFDHVTTGADGAAKLLVPSNTEVSWIVAKKAGTGFDYAEFGEIGEMGLLRGGAPAEELPESVVLILESPRVARIKAVDQDGEPVAGVDFQISRLWKEGRRSTVNSPSRIYVARTDADGIATFDWLPPSRGQLTFLPLSADYARRAVIVEDERTEPVPAVLLRTEMIRGRVVLPDGSPAKEIKVIALVVGRSLNEGGETTRTDDDGNYEMRVGPNENYVVWISDEDWAAPARLDVAVRPGEPVSRVDFRLASGTLIKGAVTTGPDDRPIAGESIRVEEVGGDATEEPPKEGEQSSRRVQRRLGARTDDQGRYAIRVGPGTYTLVGPPRAENQIETLTVANEPEMVRNFHVSRPEMGPLSVRVVAGPDARPVAQARIDVASGNFTFTLTADEEGRFQTRRYLDRTFLCAWSPDGALGSLIEIGPEDPEVVLNLTPTASATGRLLNEKGDPAAKQQLFWGRRIHLDEEQREPRTALAFANVVTDDEGRFTLPALVVGQKYDIRARGESGIPMVGVAEPQKSGRLDLGTLQVGSYGGDGED